MSITEGVELRNKDGKQIDYVSWKEWGISIWVYDYFYRITDKKLQSAIPHDVIKSMGEALVNRKFEVCKDAYEYFEHDDLIKNRAEVYGKCLLELYRKAEEDDIFIYYDAGN